MLRVADGLLVMQVELAIGEAVFSRTYKCVDTTSNQIVCLKIIKNNKEYFDQGVDEIRLLQFIARNCNVDDKHLVRLLDYFYFREHLIIVTEVRFAICVSRCITGSDDACCRILLASSRQPVRVLEIAAGARGDQLFQHTSLEENLD